MSLGSSKGKVMAMSIKGDHMRYGRVAIWLHWLSALAILCLLVLGFMAAATDDQAHKATLLRAHVPLGVLAFLLTLFRLVWLLVDRRPPPLASLPLWQAFAERFVHGCLYLLIVLLGASGIGLVVLSGAVPALFFGAPSPLPDFPSYAPMIVHGTAAFALLGLLVLHIVAALYHQFVRQDRLLQRMGVGASELRN